MSDIKEKPVEDKIEKPASRWRNWYVCTIPHAVTGNPDGKTFLHTGEKIKGSEVHPSKEIAEARALDVDGCNRGTSFANRKSVYLGAFPEGQDANH